VDQDAAETYDVARSTIGEATGEWSIRAVSIVASGSGGRRRHDVRAIGSGGPEAGEHS
jgi:hypothetical protein